MSDPASAAAVSGRAACSAAISASPLLVAVPDLVVVVAAISKILQKRPPELNQSRRSKSLVSSRRQAFLLQKTVNRAEYAAGASNRRGNDDHARYQSRSRWGCGKIENARTTRKITTIGSRNALTICAQTVSQTSFGIRQTNAAPPNTHVA